MAANLDEPVRIHARGTSGQPIELTASYIRLDVEDGKGIFEYLVTFWPAVDELRLRHLLLKQHRDIVGANTSFDGSRLLLPSRLSSDLALLSKLDDGTEVEVKVAFREQKRSGDPDSLELYNYVFLRVFRALKLVPIRSGINKAYFDPEAKNGLPLHRLDIWPGYKICVDEFEGGLLLQCDTTSKIIRTETVLQILSQCMVRNKAGGREDAKKQLLGSSLITRYNNKTYKVDDIDFDASPEDSFYDDRGNTLTFMEYYKNRHGIVIKDTKQPLIISYRKNPADKNGEPEVRLCLIPELCFVAGLTDSMRKDFMVMKDIATYTRLPPSEKERIVQTLLRSITGNEEAMTHITGWGLELAQTNLTVPSRQIPAPALHFGGGYQEVPTRGNWNRASTTRPVLKAVNLEKWAVVVSNKDERAGRGFVGMMLQQGPRLGIQVAEPNFVPLVQDRTENYLNAIRHLPKDSQIVVTIFSGSRRADRYSAVKKLCYLDLGCNSQVVMQSTLANERRMMAVVQKIALQINCKLGGELWGCNIPIKGLFVIGVDVYRDKAASSGYVAGLVASLNASFGKYHSQVVFERDGRTFIDDINAALCNAINLYKEENEQWPAHIVIFRGGVNSGQYVATQREARAICKAVADFYGAGGAEKRTSISVVVVQRRVNARFYYKSDNPPAGTVVDHTVTLRDWYDFYLISMHVNQGTVSPIYFVVLHEEDGSAGNGALKPDVLQKLAYVLTHMYFNWPGNVKVPAPCQYAHKLVEMVGEHLHKEAHASLSNRLFYL